MHQMGNFVMARRGTRRTPAWCSALLAAAIGGLAVGQAAASPAPRATKAPSAGKPDYAYFAGKTITWDVPGQVASPEDLVARALAPAVGAYLRATVNIVDFSTGNGLPGQDDAYAAAPNGLTISSLRVVGNVQAQYSGQPTVDFNMRQVPIVAGYDDNPGILVANATTGPPSIKALLTSNAPYSDLQTSSGVFPIVMDVIKSAYHLTNLHIITGYSSAGALAQGLVRGDGQMTGTAVSVLAPLLTNGYRPLLVQTPPAPGSQYYALTHRTLDVTQILAKYPPKTKTGMAEMKELLPLAGAPEWVFLPPKTPLRLQLALTSAFQHAFADPTAHAALVAAGASQKFLPPSQAAGEIAKANKGGQYLQPFFMAL